MIIKRERDMTMVFILREEKKRTNIFVYTSGIKGSIYCGIPTRSLTLLLAFFFFQKHDI